ncbi:MAG: hypothetical protein AVDCRST_MAG32-308, partial [uncultured Nocardioides sp.]
DHDSDRAQDPRPAGRAGSCGRRDGGASAGGGRGPRGCAGL